MSNIYKTDPTYDFSKLKLINPKGLQGGAYFSKLLFDDNPVLIQAPKCFTKDGIHKTEKRIYCDLKFRDTNDTFFNWIDNLEERVQNLIFEKSNIWFHNDMDMDSIQYHWQNLLRTYKKNFKLLRTFVQKPKNFGSAKLIQIYDEQENKLSLSDIKSDTEVISILEITGLKFTSQSFTLEFFLRQVMVLKNKPLFNKCLISLNDDVLNEKVEPLKININNNLEQSIDKSSSTSENNSSDQNNEPDKKNNTLTSDIITNNSENISKTDIVNNDNDNTNLDNSNKTNQSNETTQNTETNQTNKPIENNESNNSKKTLDDDNVTSETNDIKENIIQTNELNNYIDNSNDVVNNNSSEILQEPIKNDVKNEIIEIEKTLDKNDTLSEIDIKLPKPDNSIKLKPANEVYLQIYKEARKRAKEAKRFAIKTYLEAKRIKTTYLIDDIDSSDDDLEEYADLFN